MSIAAFQQLQNSVQNAGAGMPNDPLAACARFSLRMVAAKSLIVGWVRILPGRGDVSTTALGSIDITHQLFACFLPLVGCTIVTVRGFHFIW